jgi:DNA-binding transcriptional MerR regulator
MEKSPDAFRTISEVADDLDLPQHVLRFWETRFQQIKPMKRGGGRRYYRPEDVDLLKGIRHLLYDHGYTIKGVQKLLKTNGNKFVAAIASGDLATVEALAASSNEEPAPPKAGLSEEDQIVGRAKAPASRRFFSFGGNSDDVPEISLGKSSSVGKEDRALLQEALYDLLECNLLECKRLLDQVR